MRSNLLDWKVKNNQGSYKVKRKFENLKHTLMYCFKFSDKSFVH